MRKIVFRGKTETGEWVYGGINDAGTCIVRQYQFIPVDPDTIGMCTGVTDCTHTMIYEGDILQDKDDSSGDSQGVVCWECDTAFSIKNLKHSWEDVLSKDKTAMYMKIVKD